MPSISLGIRGPRHIYLATHPKVSSLVNTRILTAHTHLSTIHLSLPLHLNQLVPFKHTVTLTLPTFISNTSHFLQRNLKAPNLLGNERNSHANWIRFSLSTPHSCSIIRIKEALDNLPGTVITTRWWGSYHYHPHFKDAEAEKEINRTRKARIQPRPSGPRTHALSLYMIKGFETCL